MAGLMDKSYVRLPLYSLWGSLVFAIGLAATFPDDEITQIAVVQAESALDNKYKVKIQDLDLWWPPGVTLEGIEIAERVSEAEKKKREKKEKDDPDAPPEALPMKLRMPSVSARLSIIRSLLGGPAVEFEIDTGGGTIDGLYQQKGLTSIESRNVRIEFDEIDLRKSTLLTAYLGLPVFGEMSGDIDLEFDGKKSVLRAGAIEIKGDKITVGPATMKTDKFPPMTYFEVPQTNFGNIVAKFDVKGDDKNPTLELTEVTTDGRDIRSELWGNIRLTKTFGTSIANVKWRLQLDESFVKKNSLTPLLNLNEFRKGKSKDWFGFSLSGRVAKLQFRGSPQAAKGSKASPTVDEDEKNKKPSARKAPKRSKRPPRTPVKKNEPADGEEEGSDDEE